MPFRRRASVVFPLLLVLATASACGDGGTKNTGSPAQPESRKEWTPLVDGDVVLERIRALCRVGPRAPGTDGIKLARDEIQLQLFQAGIRNVFEQKFTAKTPDPKAIPNPDDATDATFPNETEFVNLIASIPGKSKRGIAIAAHYDSKTFSDFEFVGANDAGSAVGAVIEIAAKLRAEITEPPEDSLYFIFFDGEESIRESNQWVFPDHTYGSRHFVTTAREQGKEFPFDVTALVLLDMIGAPNLLLADDKHSDVGLRNILKEVSRDVFGFNLLTATGNGGGVRDDHEEFQRAGIPAVNLIDAEFLTPPGPPSWWHTPEDTPERLDKGSLEKVITLVLRAIPQLRAAYAR